MSRSSGTGRPGASRAASRRAATAATIGESWWSQRFLAVLESLAIGSRLSRGRSYARRGQVLDAHDRAGPGDRHRPGFPPQPYSVTDPARRHRRGGPGAPSRRPWPTRRSTAPACSPARCRTRSRMCSPRPGRRCSPPASQQLAMECSCPDWQVPCKHIAATFYLLAEAFDEDPFEILHWRGRDRATLLDTLRRLRNGERAARRPRARGRTAAARRGTATVARAARHRGRRPGQPRTWPRPSSGSGSARYRCRPGPRQSTPSPTSSCGSYRRRARSRRRGTRRAAARPLRHVRRLALDATRTAFAKIPTIMRLASQIAADHDVMPARACERRHATLHDRRDLGEPSTVRGCRCWGGAAWPCRCR